MALFTWERSQGGVRYVLFTSLNKSNKSDRKRGTKIFALQMGKGKITFPVRDEEEEWERENFNEEELEKELERTANLLRPKKFKFYYRALVTILVAVALMLMAVFAWWLVYGI